MKGIWFHEGEHLYKGETDYRQDGGFGISLYIKPQKAQIQEGTTRESLQGHTVFLLLQEGSLQLQPPLLLRSLRCSFIKTAPSLATFKMKLKLLLKNHRIRLSTSSFGTLSNSHTYVCFFLLLVLHVFK